MMSYDIMQSTGAAPTVITPAEAMRQLHCGRTYLYQLLAAGELRSIKVGRLRRIIQDSVDAYLRRLDSEQNGVSAA